MNVLRTRHVKLLMHVCAAVMSSLVVASCSTSSTDAEKSFALSSANLDQTSTEQAANPTAAVDAEAGAPAAAATQQTASRGATVLPDQAAYVPPQNQKPVQQAGGAIPENGIASSPEVTAQAKPAPDEGESDQGAATAGAEQKLTATPPKEQIMTSADPVESAQPTKKRGLLSSLFSANQAAAAPAPARAQAPVIENQAKAPLVKLASIEPTEQLAISRSSTGSYGSDALPGVRKSALFEIKRKSGLDDDSDVDLNEEDDYSPVRVASAAGMARLAPNGLLRQHESVDVGCLKPSLVRQLKQLESHFGRKMIVTSGYRSPSHNRKVRGARNSQHMYCAAVDIQIPGVSKWDLAAYARSMPGRGGVGTYCHTESVHVDIGPERDWNWRCRRRKA